MKASITLALLATRAVAYPWLSASAPAPASEERDLVGGLLGGIVSGVEGLLGSVASAVDLSNKRPDAAHPFIAPGPTDQRGPCPALNLLANHGYLPRTGIVTAGDVLYAVAEGFNMAADLAAALLVVAVGTGGNIDTLTFSIGGEDNRTYTPTGIGSRAAGRQYGLDKHSTCECDASATRDDFFLANGDNHSGNGSRFKRFVELAIKNGGRFNLAAANQLYAQNAKLSVENNPRFYGGGYTLLVILGEYPFIPYMFSNGTYEAGGTANYESISSILGYQLDKKTGEFCYVPERFPDHWYRRATPYGIANQFVPQLFPTFAQYPIAGTPLSDVLGNPAEAAQALCQVFQLLDSFVPASLVGSSVARVAAVEAYISKTLLPLLPGNFQCSLSGGKNGTAPQTEDSLQETRPGGHQQYNVCKA